MSSNLKEFCLTQKKNCYRHIIKQFDEKPKLTEKLQSVHHEYMIELASEMLRQETTVLSDKEARSCVSSLTSRLVKDGQVFDNAPSRDTRYLSAISST